jgi:hypothetical protein
MKNKHPKFLTKAELRGTAMRELKVSKNSFEFAWIDAIEETGRQDWYEPLRRPIAEPKAKNFWYWTLRRKEGLQRSTMRRFLDFLGDPLREATLL